MLTAGLSASDDSLITR